MSEIIIRPAQTADYPSFARLFPELLVGDPVPDAARWRDELLPSSFIAEDGSGVIGYSYFQMIGGTGYIRHVVVAPSARGRGVGERIMAALRQRFRDCGGKTWELNVKPDNHAAIRLYERFGLRPQYRSTALGLPWALVDSLAPAETPVVVRIVQPDEDLRFESALHLIDGQLHSGRVLPGRVIVGLVYAADGAPRGSDLPSSVPRRFAVSRGASVVRRGAARRHAPVRAPRPAAARTLCRSGCRRGSRAGDRWGHGATGGTALPR